MNSDLANKDKQAYFQNNERRKIALRWKLIDIILKKVSPAMYQALGIFIPLITTNCAIIRVAILTIQKEFNFVEGMVYAIANAIGFGLALILFAKSVKTRICRKF